MWLLITSMNKEIFNFDEELTRIQPALFGFIKHMCPNRHDAEDILQKTNFIILSKRKEYDHSIPIRSWIFSVARFQFRAYLTMRSRCRITYESDLLTTHTDESSTRDSFEQSKKELIQYSALNQCYSKLPDHMQEIAYLRFKKNLQLKDISCKVNRPVGSISATLDRIKTHISLNINKAYRDSELIYEGATT